ncbi:TrmB family transcriptional regulator [Clostridium botulinum]|uniref:TrmB family transcriptional regulator n=1 Tax=Clostridium botulinum TaxID=1491 RepID=A0A0C3M8I2_CLOBO|nr:transcriptional regulator [Clostridium botulinum]KIN79880.1 transcriptional regulator [Clostridium botulinum]MCC5425831.1 helix-turn-helix domain-containing protein [Clostridium botulinum]NFD76022.1 TrmB family transcriptional regulator [Clostridium botulinum]NFD83593.1 TrmB family transcriptional regulator [Clostridium botulinum]NFE08336.1 TrmB family transcriptional regulator [Clostridium botulinum]
MSSFYRVDDVAEILDISISKAYRIIRQLNKELEQKGYITIAGRVPIKYFKEKYYC